MLVRLMNKEVIAADLHLDVHIGGNNVYNVVIHKKELLPEPLKAAADNANTPEGFLDACFEVWLKERAIPDSRIIWTKPSCSFTNLIRLGLAECRGSSTWVLWYAIICPWKMITGLHRLKMNVPAIFMRNRPSTGFI